MAEESRRWNALYSGIVGACVLTIIHESVRRINPDAPRMDLLGKRAITYALEQTNQDVPDQATLQNMSLAGDIVSNSLYYSLVGNAKGTVAYLRGALLGLGAGLGALYLPGPMGLGKDASQRTPATQVMTVSWYLLGGLAAAATAALLNSSDE